MKKLLPGVILLCATLFVCALIGEIAVRLVYPGLANYNMEMWRYASEIKQRGPSEALPFHHRADASGEYYGAEISTNSFGFRDREVSVERVPGTDRVLMIGDSFTLGWGVPFDSLYSKELERLLSRDGRPAEVINLGVGNYNTAMELELLRSKGLQFQPDLIVVMHFVNDAEPTPERLGRLRAAVLTRSYLFAFLFDKWVKVKGLWDPGLDWKTFYASLYEPDAPGFQENRTALSELLTLGEERGIPVLVATIPELRELDPYPFPHVTEFVRSTVEETGAHFLDLLPALVEEEPSSLWVTVEDPHANGKANLLIADALHEKIRARGLLGSGLRK